MNARHQDSYFETRLSSQRVSNMRPTGGRIRPEIFFGPAPPAGYSPTTSLFQPLAAAAWNSTRAAAESPDVTIFFGGGGDGASCRLKGVRSEIFLVDGKTPPGYDPI